MLRLCSCQIWHCNKNTALPIHFSRSLCVTAAMVADTFRDDFRRRLVGHLKSSLAQPFCRCSPRHTVAANHVSQRYDTNTTQRITRLSLYWINGSSDVNCARIAQNRRQLLLRRQIWCDRIPILPKTVAPSFKAAESYSGREDKFMNE